MISWMQKHNKYLVWTIWVATIAFIGAGFVGWGSYDMGSKAGSIAKVGEIEIKQAKLNATYSTIYNQYNEYLKGTLDKKKAQEMGLIKQAFSQIATQAKVLNFANEFGLLVSNEEVAEHLQEIKGFQTEGVFDKKIYKAYLQNQRLKAKDFEEALREDLRIQKVLGLINVGSLAFEEEALAKAMNISDKIAYQVLSKKDLNISIDNTKVKSYWEMSKTNFINKKQYVLSIVWTGTKDTNISDDEIKTFYDTKSFNYTDSQGKQLSLEDAKEAVIQDLKLKKTKKTAQKAYIAFKKGKLESSETLTLDEGDLKLSFDVWRALQDKVVGDILKPKVVADTYATIKIDKIIASTTKTFDQAKEEVTALYLEDAEKKALVSLAEGKVKDFDENHSIVSDFIKLEENVQLASLNTDESLKFVQKLFTSTTEKGMISISDKIVVYKILEQKFSAVDANQTNMVKETTKVAKERIFESNLLKLLDKKYTTEVYVEGLTN